MTHSLPMLWDQSTMPGSQGVFVFNFLSEINDMFEALEFS